MSHAKTIRRLKRRKRVRARVQGTAARPRMSVFRSLCRIVVQLIDDEHGRTLIAADSREAKAPLTVAGAKKLGTVLAKKAKEKGITTVVFDRGGYRYHGRIKALADASRESGLQF